MFLDNIRIVGAINYIRPSGPPEAKIDTAFRAYVMKYGCDRQVVIPDQRNSPYLENEEVTYAPLLKMPTPAQVHPMGGRPFV